MSRVARPGEKMSRRWSDSGMVKNEIKKPILSPMLSKFLRRCFLEVLGVLLLLFGAVLPASLLSASRVTLIGVASMNETANFRVTGANIANVLEQMLGYAMELLSSRSAGDTDWIRKQKISARPAIAAPIAMALLATGFYGIGGGDAGIEGGGETTDGGAGRFSLISLHLYSRISWGCRLTKTHYVGIGFGLSTRLAWSAALSRSQQFLSPRQGYVSVARKSYYCFLFAAEPVQATNHNYQKSKQA